MAREPAATALPYLKTCKLKSLAEAESRGLIRLMQYCEQRAIVLIRIVPHLKAGACRVWWTQDSSQFRTRWVDPREADDGLLAAVRDNTATARAIKLWREDNPRGYAPLELGEEEGDDERLEESAMVARLRKIAGLPAQGKLSPVEARAIHTAIRAEQEYIKLQEAKGRLIDKEEARTEAFKLAREYSTRMLAWPSRAAPSLAAKLRVPVGDLIRALNESIREELDSIADLQSRGVDLLTETTYDALDDERSGTDG